MYYLIVVTSHKIALSFLISVLLFGAFASVAFTGLFDLLETRFYNPAVRATITRDNAQNVQAVDRFLTDMQTRFAEPLNANAVRSAFLYSRSIEDILARERIFRLLGGSIEGIQWIRFIDTEGVRIHFSTYFSDILRSDGLVPIFANYNEPFLPYELIAVGAGEAPRITFDERAGRILFSFPLYDSVGAYWGTALYSLAISALENRLISEGRMRFGQDITVVSNPAGLLFGLAAAGEVALPYHISPIWEAEG